MRTQYLSQKITRLFGPGALYCSIIFTCFIIFTLNIIRLISIHHKNDTIILTQRAENSRSITLKNIWHSISLNEPNAASGSDIHDKPIQKLDIIINGIVMTSRSADTFILVSEGGSQKRYRVNDTLQSNPAIKIRKINRTSVIFESHNNIEKVTLHPVLSLDSTERLPSGSAYVLADVLTATPVRDGNILHGLRLQPKTGYDGFENTLLQPGDVAIRLNNIPLSGPDEIAEAISSLLTLQSVQFTVRRNGVPRVINVSVSDIIGKNGKSDERIQ